MRAHQQRKCEGLKRGCTEKGSKEGSGGKEVKVLVVISYEKGVIKCVKYEKVNGDFFPSFVEKNFETIISFTHTPFTPKLKHV